MKFPRFSLRTKLILTFLFTIAIGGIVSLIVGSGLVKNTLISQAQSKVQHDLASAWMVFNGKLGDIKDIVTLTAARESLHEAVLSDNRALLLRYLNRVRNEYGLDIMTLTDPEGRVMVRTRNPEAVGQDLSQDDLVKRALLGGTYAFPQIVPREELLREGSDLAQRAWMEFIPTPMAAERPETFETNGLMLKAAASVWDESGRVLGVLYGGVLLNRNYDIVDSVKELVYQGEKYKGAEVGTATIFQHDLRISTNVRNKDGQRAIGTRVSKAVNQAVLVEGQPWIDRAFVVNDWYITAYEPIRDAGDRIIGILYVGMLEKPYIDTTNRVMFTFTILASLCVLFLLLILYFSTDQIIKPLQRMAEATQGIASGDLSHKVVVNTRDEVGRLADSFNQMTENLRQANQRLVEWGKTLEKKVDERTHELQEAQAHLIQSEKLASVGKLAAGIAHEINNPLGGILIYSHLLMEDIGKEDPAHDTLKKIVKETSRCKDIVKGLLEFARPRDPSMTLTDITEVAERALAILERQALFQNITIEKDYAPLPRIVADGSQLQQVFMNIILNAAESMNGTGLLSIKTRLDEPNRSIRVEFTDSGQGIAPEDMKRLFEPFFSTKEVGKGTGLGLAISYGIIRKHGGSIQVSSMPGQGATFAVLLPLKDSAHE